MSIFSSSIKGRITRLFKGQYFEYPLFCRYNSSFLVQKFHENVHNYTHSCPHSCPHIFGGKFTNVPNFISNNNNNLFQSSINMSLKSLNVHYFVQFLDFQKKNKPLYFQHYFHLFYLFKHFHKFIRKTFGNMIYIIFS